MLYHRLPATGTHTQIDHSGKISGENLSEVALENTETRLHRFSHDRTGNNYHDVNTVFNDDRAASYVCCRRLAREDTHGTPMNTFTRYAESLCNYYSARTIVDTS